MQSEYGGGYGDGFLARVSASGDNLEYATFLGGKFYDQIDAVTYDSCANSFLTGVSGGFLQPTTPGAY